MLTKREGVAEFIRRLEAADPVDSGATAFELLSRTLNEVEDEYSMVPYDPSKYRSDHRLYPPQEDNTFPVENRQDLTRYRSAGHNTWISVYGAIRIEDLETICVLNKPGRNGRTIELDQ